MENENFAFRNKEHKQKKEYMRLGFMKSLYLQQCSFRDCITITKKCLYNVDPFKPHFYIVKLGFTGVYIIFLISAQKHRLWVLVRTASPRRGGPNKYPQSMF